MYDTVYARNVNEAFDKGIILFSQSIYATERKSIREIVVRNRNTLERVNPVMTIYTKPKERVLFDRDRDANPFFHFMEALWMLAGRRDVKWMDYWNSQLKQFSDDGKTYHGAYGYRLRNYFGLDQLNNVINLLKNDPNTRRAVLQIWDCKRDLGNTWSKDLPCNDIIFFKLREQILDMTVCCRSNDMIWGCYGSNAVHFSMIQEYIAGMLNIKVGIYRHLSDSFHIYPDVPCWKILEKRGPLWQDPYKYNVFPYLMFSGIDDRDSWGWALNRFMADPFNIRQKKLPAFFMEVAYPMAITYKQHKENSTGLSYVENIKASDWRLACKEWLGRREA